MKPTFICVRGERVRTYCYMAIVRGMYACICICERTSVSTVVLTYVRMYVCVPSYGHATGTLAYVHIDMYVHA